MWNEWEGRCVCVCMCVYTYLGFWWVIRVENRPLGRSGRGWEDSVS